jgi:hypothetical protein
LKKKDLIEIGTVYEHPQARDYVTQELKELLHDSKNDCNQTFLQELIPTESTDHSLWKATKKLKCVKKSPPLQSSQGT